MDVGITDAMGSIGYGGERAERYLEVEQTDRGLCRAGSFEGAKMVVDYIGDPHLLRPKIVFERKMFDSSILYEFDGRSYYGVEDRRRATGCRRWCDS